MDPNANVRPAESSDNENPPKKRCLKNFRCPAESCFCVVGLSDVLTHLPRCHQAITLERHPLSDSVSWEASLFKVVIKEFFSACRVPEWGGIFFFREVRQKQNNDLISSFYIQSVGTYNKSTYFQYELTYREDESDTFSLVGNVKHIFVPLSAIKTCFKWRRRETTGKVVKVPTFTITIRKKCNKSGAVLTFD